MKNSRAIQRIFRTDKYYAVVFLKPSKYFIVNSLAKGSRHGEEVCDYAMPFSASYNFCANSSSGPQSCTRRISAEYRSFRLVIAPRSGHVPAHRVVVSRRWVMSHTTHVSHRPGVPGVPDIPTAVWGRPRTFPLAYRRPEGKSHDSALSAWEVD